MLSDFDLSKQSGEPGGAPVVIRQSTQNGVSAHEILAMTSVRTLILI